jgi:signal transduction histidine kinase
LFWAGLFFGLIVATLVAAAIGAVAYRRVIAAERQARESQRLAELGTLTGGLAHEIKNPLSTVQLNLQLLQEDLAAERQVPTRVTNRLRTIRQETGRLRDILDDFLRYAGRIEVERGPVDVTEMLDELVDFFAPQAQLAKVQIRLNRPDKPVIADADGKLLRQAVLNLMLNATQAMAGKGANTGGELILAPRQLDGRVLIDVIDTGPGIAAEEQPKIFEAYYSKKRGGTGLGLAMTRRILEEHGGKVLLKSEVGKGSCFTLDLPARKNG